MASPSAQEGDSAADCSQIPTTSDVFEEGLDGTSHDETCHFRHRGKL